MKIRTTCFRAVGPEANRPSCSIHGSVIKNGKVYLAAGETIICDDCRKLLNATHRLFKHERPVTLERLVG